MLHFKIISIARDVEESSVAQTERRKSDRFMYGTIVTSKKIFVIEFDNFFVECALFFNFLYFSKMGIFNKLFGIREKGDNFFSPRIEIQFGRYSDNNKSLSQRQKWMDADRHFKEKNYFQCFTDFFDYLRDDSVDNVQFNRVSDTKLEFKIFQGSKIVIGSIDENNILAKVSLVTMENVSVPVMRRLLETNYALSYVRFALDNKQLFLLLDSDIEIAGPNKLYYGLKELATVADKQDDLLLKDFATLKPSETTLEIPFSTIEKEVKYKYFKLWIESSLKRIEELNQDTFSGGIAYLLLDLIYKIDFLIAPEGKLLLEIERINNLYWANKENKTTVERNQILKDAFQKLLLWSKEEVVQCFYRSKATFAITKTEPYETVVNSIEESYQNMAWYRDNKYPDIASVVQNFGILYSQYSYSLPSVFTELFVLYMQINNNDFFSELGFSENYYHQNQFKFLEIKNRIDKIIFNSKEKYRFLSFDTSKLSFTHLLDFNTSFLNEVQNLNFEIKN